MYVTPFFQMKKLEPGGAKCGNFDRAESLGPTRWEDRGRIDRAESWGRIVGPTGGANALTLAVAQRKNKEH